MANVKISALPTTGVSASDDFFVINDAANTTTSKIELQDFAGLTKGNGTQSMKSADWLHSSPAMAENDYSIAMGWNASAVTDNTIAIGKDAEATSPNSIAIGNGAFNTNNDGNRDGYIAIGYEAQSVQYGVAIGYQANNLGGEGVVIGRSNLNTANWGVVIGRDNNNSGDSNIVIGPYNQATGGYGCVIGSVCNQNQYASYVLAYNKSDIYPQTLHSENFYSYGQITQNRQNIGTGDTFNIDWNAGGMVEMTLTGNSTCSMSNVRDGSTYTVYVTTTGSQSLTPSASGFTFKFVGGGFTFTNNGTDCCVLDVVGTTIYVRHFADFS
jgi:hypothetical protein